MKSARPVDGDRNWCRAQAPVVPNATAAVMAGLRSGQELSHSLQLNVNFINDLHEPVRAAP